MKYFGEILEEWVNYIELQVKPSTYACYTRLIKTHIEPYFQAIPAEQINQALISDFIAQKLQVGRTDGKGGLSEKTVKDIMSVINNAFNYAEIIYGIQKPVVFRWRYSSISKPVEIFTESEQKKLENYLLKELNPQKLGILICLYSGIRLGEICALCWNDIDTQQKIFHIRRNVQRIYTKDERALTSEESSTKIIIGTPKTQASLREIPIASHLWELLWREREKFPCATCIISEKSGTFHDPRTYQLHYKKYLQECGLRYRNFHALRHTFATRCIEKNIDIKSLSEILGHSSVNITLNRYVHSSMEQKRSQIEKLCGNIERINDSVSEKTIISVSSDEF